MMGQGVGEMSQTEAELGTEGFEDQILKMGPGYVLKSFRTKQNIKLENAASYLGVSMTFIQAMEADDFSHPMLKDNHELLGYFQKYAQFLNLPVEEVDTRYHQQVQLCKENQNQANPIGFRFIKVRWILAASVIFGVVELVYWANHKPVIIDDEMQLTEQQRTIQDTIQDMVMSELQAEELDRPKTVYSVG